MNLWITTRADSHLAQIRDYRVVLSLYLLCPILQSLRLPIVLTTANHANLGVESSITIRRGNLYSSKRGRYVGKRGEDRPPSFDHCETRENQGHGPDSAQGTLNFLFLAVSVINLWARGTGDLSSSTGECRCIL